MDKNHSRLFYIFLISLSQGEPLLDHSGESCLLAEQIQIAKQSTITMLCQSPAKCQCLLLLFCPTRRTKVSHFYPERNSSLPLHADVMPHISILFVLMFMCIPACCLCMSMVQTLCRQELLSLQLCLQYYQAYVWTSKMCSVNQ